MKLSKPLTFFVLLLVLQSCYLIPKKPGIWQNEKIESGKRKDFNELTANLLKNIKTGDKEAVESLLSKDLLENGNHHRVVEVIGNHMKTDDYTMVDEYYIVNDLKHKELIKPNTDSLNLEYNAVEREMYIAFFLPKKSANQYMITVVYGRFDYGWKVDKIEFEPYTKNGKTAPELYKEAQLQMSKGYLVNAINTMAMARACSAPSEELKAPLDREMSIFYGRLVNQANTAYRFPYTITAVATQPKIFRIGNQNVGDDTYPSIYYLSKINIKDTVAIKKENDNVKKVIGKIIPGVDQDKKYLLYSIFNKMPNSHENAYSFDIKDKLQ